jgi:hypothetical protein
MGDAFDLEQLGGSGRNKPGKTAGAATAGGTKVTSSLFLVCHDTWCLHVVHVLQPAHADVASRAPAEGNPLVLCVCPPAAGR